MSTAAPTDKASAEGTNTEKPANTLPQLGALEEDDEFEEFATQGAFPKASEG